MTELATCSYAGWRPGHGTPVRITLGQARWLPPGRQRWLYVAELAPRGWYFHAEPDMFTRRYGEQLDRLADDIDTKLGWLSDQYGPLVLCCWERRVRGPADCHRRQFAEWWTARTGEEVPELDPKTRK